MSRRFVLILLLALFSYLSLYTWNVRTGYLDSLATYSGLEFVGWTLLPGKLVAARAARFSDNYIHLAKVQRENEVLHEKLQQISSALVVSREEAAEVKRLRSLLSFEPPPHWKSQGGRVVAYRLGPHAALETLLVDKGTMAGIQVNTPVVTHEGVVGKVLRVSPFFSTVLLATDLNSKLSVLGQTHRTQGILAGKGPDELLQVLYVPLNATVEAGELLITSGLDDTFPKGLPVARITRVERSEISLFLDVWAELLIDVKNLEEVLLLRRENLASGSSGSLQRLP